MASLPDSLRLTSAESIALEEIHRKARIRHEKERKAASRRLEPSAKARGRKDFPESPYEDSWAFEEEFRRGYREGSTVSDV